MTKLARGFIKSSSKIQPFSLLSDFVRTITLDIQNDDRSSPGSESDPADRLKYPEWMNGTSLPAIFPLPFRFLECFSIRYKNYRIESSDWNYFSSETKDALSNIILSSTGTLKSLSLSGLPMCRLPSSYTFPTLRHWS